jgi:hypothetical protein
MRDRWRLDWEAALRALPFFIQRLAVVLAGLVVAVLALLGGLAVLIRPVGAPPPPAPVIQGGQPPATQQPPGTGPSHSPTPGQPPATAPGARSAPSAPPTTTPGGGAGRSAPPAAPPGTSTTTPSTAGGLIGGLVDRLLPPSTS